MPIAQGLGLCAAAGYLRGGMAMKLLVITAAAAFVVTAASAQSDTRHDNQPHLRSTIAHACQGAPPQDGKRPGRAGGPGAGGGRPGAGQSGGRPGGGRPGGGGPPAGGGSNAGP